MKKALFLSLSVLISLAVLSQNNCKTYKLMDNAYINLSSVNIEVDNSYTVMGWMKWNSNTMQSQSWSEFVEASNVQGDDFRQFWIQTNSNNSRVEFAMQLNTGDIDDWSEVSMKEGEWFHFAAVYNGQQQVLYINGVKESSKMSTGRSDSFNPDVALSLGSFAAWNFDQDYLGEVDKISIWNRAMSQEEIEHAMVCKNPDNCSGLISYYSEKDVNNILLNDENYFNHIAVNDSKEESKGSVNYNFDGQNISWESDIAYQKAHESDEVYVSFNNNVYKLKTWYSFNENPEENNEAWENIYFQENIQNTFMAVEE